MERHVRCKWTKHKKLPKIVRRLFDGITVFFNILKKLKIFAGCIRYIKCKMQRNWKPAEKEVEKIEKKEALQQMMSKYKNLIFSICLKMTGDYFTAEDLSQETFLSVYEHLDSFDGKNEKAWICRIASNLCIDYKRQAARREISTSEQEMPPAVTVEEPLELYLNRETMEEFQKRCRDLKPPYDAVAYAYYYEGKTVDEIAAGENKKKKTIQTQIYRARSMLQKVYGKERGTYGRTTSGQTKRSRAAGGQNA